MSVVVDQMTHMPNALLEDRSGEALDNWLAGILKYNNNNERPWKMFHRAINRIIPGVTQICDRFHLTKNDGHNDTGNRETDSSDQAKAQIRIS